MRYMLISLVLATSVAVALPSAPLQKPGNSGDARSPLATDFPTRRTILSAAGPVRAVPIAGDVGARPVSERGLRNLTAMARVVGYLSHFNATDQAAGTAWDLVMINAVDSVERATNASELAKALNEAFQASAPDFCAYTTPVSPCEIAKPRSAVGALAWKHLGRQITSDNVYLSERIKIASLEKEHSRTLNFGEGLRVQVPTAAWIDESGRTIRTTQALAPTTKPAGWTPSGHDRSTRISAVIIAWNMFQHFYPYFDVIKIDWPQVLRVSLQSAATDKDDTAFVATLEKLVAKLEDGHGAVVYTKPQSARLPLAWDWIDNQLVVTGVGASAVGFMVGDTIQQIGGTDVKALLAEKRTRSSGSSQWRLHLALESLLRADPGQAIAIRYRSNNKARATTLIAALERVAEKRPAVISELRPGILYVDLTRTPGDDGGDVINRLAKAKGLIFDLRGYPKVSPAFLSYLSAKPFASVPMRIPEIKEPDRVGWIYRESAWQMPPMNPRFTQSVMVLTDKRAISFSESLLGTLKGAKLGLLVGEPSAGANGNTNPFPLPGGYVVVWTGMQVLDARRSKHHTVGVIPDYVVKRTRSGVSAGHDEVLDQALRLLEAKAS